MSKPSTHSSSPRQSTGTGPIVDPGHISEYRDEALLQGCIAGNQAAWRELVHRFSGLVYSVPARLGLDEASSEDVFQMVFEVLLKQLRGPRLRDHRSLPKWLLTAAQRISWKVIARNKRHEGAANTPAPTVLDPTEQLLQWERQHQVRQALIKLGGRCEELLTALYLGPNEPNHEQVAKTLGIPVGSIGPTRARCIVKLIEILDDSDDQ